MKYYDLTKEEQEMLDSVERGEWKSVDNLEEAKKTAVEAAENTLNKRRNVNLRLSERDLQKTKALAAQEGIPYQTYLASIIHKSINGVGD